MLTVLIKLKDHEVSVGKKRRIKDWQQEAMSENPVDIIIILFVLMVMQSLFQTLFQTLYVRSDLNKKERSEDDETIIFYRNLVSTGTAGDV